MTEPLAVELGGSRYDRQERITWWDQNRLRDARVLVAGAGAIGNELVKNLVLLGVGSIVVVDTDQVELSNLARCVFFRPGDEGESKSAVLARRARDLNPDVNVIGLARDIRSFGTGIGIRADVMVGALDNREARLFVNRLAWRVGRPWVDGAIEALMGIARVFHPPDSCYECTLSEGDFAVLAHRQSCRLLDREDLLEGKVPTTATTSSVVAGLQAQEVVKLLHSSIDGVRVLDGGVVLDGANNDAYVIRYPHDDECAAHHPYLNPIEVHRTDETTFRDVVHAAGFETALIELGDDYLVGWTCPECARADPASGVIGLLSFEQSRCPRCEEPRQPSVTARIEVPGEHADGTLSEFAVRADEVFAVRRGGEYRYVWGRERVPGLPEGWQ